MDACAPSDTAVTGCAYFKNSFQVCQNAKFFYGGECQSNAPNYCSTSCGKDCEIASSCLYGTTYETCGLGSIYDHDVAPASQKCVRKCVNQLDKLLQACHYMNADVATECGIGKYFFDNKCSATDGATEAPGACEAAADDSVKIVTVKSCNLDGSFCPVGDYIYKKKDVAKQKCIKKCKQSVDKLEVACVTKDENPCDVGQYYIDNVCRAEMIPKCVASDKLENACLYNEDQICAKGMKFDGACAAPVAGNKGLEGGAVAGIAIAVAVVVAIIVGVAVFCCVKPKSSTL